MKRLVLIIAAAAATLTPMAVATEASAQRYGRNDRYERNQRYDGFRGGQRYYYRDEYTPPRVYYAPRPGYGWRRGGYLPPAYSGYYVSDYGRYGLRPPPRGYRWHRVGNDYLLAAIATGLIFDIVTR